MRVLVFHYTPFISHTHFSIYGPYCFCLFSQFAGVLPKDRILGSIRLNEVANALNAKLLYGKESFNNDTEVRTEVVCAGC